MSLVAPSQVSYRSGCANEGAYRDTTDMIYCYSFSKRKQYRSCLSTDVLPHQIINKCKLVLSQSSLFACIARVAVGQILQAHQIKDTHLGLAQLTCQGSDGYML